MLDDLALARRAALAGTVVSLRCFIRVRALTRQQTTQDSVVTEASLIREA
ncbi:hypothetical protein ACWGJB_49210 [Streptomyces sp. NPDC054813]